MSATSPLRQVLDHATRQPRAPIYCQPRGPFVPMARFYADEEEERTLPNGHKIIVGAFELRADEVYVQRQLAGLALSWEEVRDLEAGRYARMVERVGAQDDIRNIVWMSDTPMERRTNLDFVRRATGRVLIAGLGLGLCLVPILAKPDVAAVTVIERSPEMIDLIAPQRRFAAVPGVAKLTVICADIEDVRPRDTIAGGKWTTIYFDIWPDICGDNAPQMRRLHHRWSPYLDRADPAASMDSWRKQDTYRLARDRR